MWDVSEIASIDRARAALLLHPPSPSALRAVLVERLKLALLRGTARLAAERRAANPLESRAVAQFWVGSQVFDWFFNGANGYRAQYRADAGAGLRYNDLIVAESRRVLLDLLPPVITVRVLTPAFEDTGEENVATREWARSLQPALSKVWMCGSLIQTDGSQPTSLPAGIDGARIKVGLPHDWASISRVDADAWVEIKGAFAGPSGFYQPKDPEDRAQRLHTHGEA